MTSNYQYSTWIMLHEVQAIRSKLKGRHDSRLMNWFRPDDKRPKHSWISTLWIDAWISKWNTVHIMMLLNIIHITWSFYHGAWSMSRFLAWFTGNLTSLVRTNQLLSIRLEVLISSGGDHFHEGSRILERTKIRLPDLKFILLKSHIKFLGKTFTKFDASRTMKFISILKRIMCKY